MRFIVLFTFVISVNINAQFKVKLKKVENIFIELNENQSINVGRPISFKAFARLKNGKVKDITYHSGFSVSGNGIEKKNNGRILILPNNNCDKVEYSMVAILSDNEYTFKDSLNLIIKGVCCVIFLEKKEKMVLMEIKKELLEEWSEIGMGEMVAMVRMEPMEKVAHI